MIFIMMIVVSLHIGNNIIKIVYTQSAPPVKLAVLIINDVLRKLFYYSCLLNSLGEHPKLRLNTLQR